MEILSEAGGCLSGSGYQTSLEAGSHRFMADEPASLGGEDAGPDPYSLLLSSLIACTAITLRMYAERKQWPLENVRVQCRLIRREEGAPLLIERMISTEGPLLDREQKDRLLQIANACPVHKLLATGISIETSGNHSLSA